MTTLEPVGTVVGGRFDAVDDDWGSVEAIVRLDAQRFDPEAVTGLEAFSHLCVVFRFHLVAESAVVLGARGRSFSQMLYRMNRNVCSRQECSVLNGFRSTVYSMRSARIPTRVFPLPGAP